MYGVSAEVVKMCIKFGSNFAHCARGSRHIHDTLAKVKQKPLCSVTNFRKHCDAPNGEATQKKEPKDGRPARTKRKK